MGLRDHPLNTFTATHWPESPIFFTHAILFFRGHELVVVLLATRDADESTTGWTRTLILTIDQINTKSQFHEFIPSYNLTAAVTKHPSSIFFTASPRPLIDLFKEIAC